MTRSCRSTDIPLFEIGGLGLCTGCGGCGGAIPLCYRGCGDHDLLVAAGPDVGRVWFDVRAFDDPISPTCRRHRGVTFDRWHPTWL
jgi:hypothetical protein